MVVLGIIADFQNEDFVSENKNLSKGSHYYQIRFQTASLYKITKNS